MPNKTDLRGEREGGREEGREGEREGIKMKIKNSFHPKFFAMRFEGDENRLFKSNNFVSPPPPLFLLLPSLYELRSFVTFDVQKILARASSLIKRSERFEYFNDDSLSWPHTACPLYENENRLIE